MLDQLSRLTQLDPRSPLAGHLDLQHVGIIGHSIGGATAVQVIAADPRFKVAVNLDGKLFGAQSAAHLNRPLLWIQSDGPQTAEYTQGRDRLLSRLRDGGALLTILGSVHIGLHRRPGLPDRTRTLRDRPRNRHRLDLARRHDLDDRRHDLRLRRTRPRRQQCGLGCPFTRPFAWTD